MSLGKASAFTLSLVAAVALGVWVSPHVRTTESLPSVISANDGTATAPAASSADTRRPTPTRPGAAVAARAAVPTPALDDTTLHAQLRPLLKSGVDMELALEDFRTADEFAAVVHAAHNTGVPFVLLKHRVVYEGMTLAEAIAASLPDVHSAIEADRAVAEAWSDLAAVARRAA